MQRIFRFVLAGMLLFAGTPTALAAEGTATGTIKGPHGETAAVNYTFTNRATGDVISGTTNSDGTYSQTLDPTVDYSFAATAPTSETGYEFADNISIPYVRVPDGGTLKMGDIFFHFRVPENDSELDEDSPRLPSQCSDTPGPGEPVIVRIEYLDSARGSFLYTGRNAGIKIYTDNANYTVTADYSILEGSQPGSIVKAATNNGDGTYTVAHTLETTAVGGGMVIVSATNTTNDTSTACSEDGPTNLDIRTAEVSSGGTMNLNGSDTTDFTQVEDFRAIENFTMHRDGVFKVVFRKKVNMLDRTVQKFMKSLARKMTADNGTFSLDAKAVIELKNAGAEITMYNVDYLSTPTILLDGSDPGSAVSDVVYNKDAKTLTFLAAHFSEYKAVPTITFSSPTDKTTTSDEKVTIKGSVNDADATVKIYVNGTDQGTITVGSDGAFSKEVSLTTGENTVKITASNEIGSALDVSHTVTRQSLPATGTPTAITVGLLLVLMTGIALYASAQKNQTAA